MTDYQAISHQITSKASAVGKQPLLQDNLHEKVNQDQYNGLFIQRKLSVSTTDDFLEKEADAMADKVMRMPMPEPVNFSSAKNLISRTCSHCEKEKELHRKESNSETTTTTPSIVNDVLNSSDGKSLDSEVRSFMEPRFNYNFSNVKIHDNDLTAKSADSINALAYTSGNNIVFNSGQYNPNSDSGKKLLAHELTHTIQQGIATKPSSPAVQRQQAPGTSSPVPANGGLSDKMLEQVARRLRNAMSGLGTDEEAIYSSFAGRSQEQVDAIAGKYQNMYRRSLLADLQDELNSDEMKHMAIFSPTATGGKESSLEGSSGVLAEMIAVQLREAISGCGTDESSIMAALTGRTQTELTSIKNAYQHLTGHQLEADLREDLSGSELTEAMQLFRQGMLAEEDELYLATKGLGTDEGSIYRVLNSLAGDRNAILDMESRYRNKYGDLIQDLRDDLSEDEYQRAMIVLEPAIPDAAFEDCANNIIPQIRALIPIGIQKVDKAISVLSKGLSGMTSIELNDFLDFFDPGRSGQTDEIFVWAVLANYLKIRTEFKNDLTVECEKSSWLCDDQRLYYTYWSNIHVCPYFALETDPDRKARDFVHELVHNALLTIDRAYYTDRDAFNKLTPWGSSGEAGTLFNANTLTNPDSYSRFAFKV